MENLIKASDFVKHLKQEGLVIISLKELDQISNRALLQKRNDLLKKKFLKISELLALKLLPVKTSQGIRHWINEGKIKPTELMKLDNGVIKISTSFLIRAGYVN